MQTPQRGGSVLLLHFGVWSWWDKWSILHIPQVQDAAGPVGSSALHCRRTVGPGPKFVLLSCDRRACTAPFCFWKENGSTRALCLIDWRSIGVSQSDGTWPQYDVALLPKEGISYCRIGKVGSVSVAMVPALLEAGALRRLLKWHCTDRLLLFAQLYPWAFNRLCYFVLDSPGLDWTRLVRLDYG